MTVVVGVAALMGICFERGGIYTRGTWIEPLVLNHRLVGYIDHSLGSFT